MAALLCGAASTSHACGLFQDRFGSDAPAGWIQCIDVSIDAPASVLVTVQTGLNEAGQNFTEAVIAPQPGYVLQRAHVTTDCAAGLVWENNTVRIDPVTAPCQLQIAEPAFAINPDTGIAQCGSVNALADCAIAGYPGQDAETGLDLLDGRVKAGSGVDSRDYTKLDAHGRPLPEDASVWSCVRDNLTGLVWEHKVNNADSIHHVNHTFSWYSEDAATNGGANGTLNNGNCRDLISCDTAGLVAAVNDIELCGRSDWSLPSPAELSGLLSWSDVNAASLIGDATFFPHRSTVRHWTFVPNADISAYGVVASTRDNASGGLIGSDSRSTGRAALLVSRQDAPQPPAASNPPPSNACQEGFPATTPSHYFSIVGDGSLVRDQRTGLIWQRCMLGQSWNEADQTCDDPSDGVALFTWQQALQAADDATPSGWRLPNRHEAATIIEFCNSEPPINQQVFPNTTSRLPGGAAGKQWTSSPNIQRPAPSTAPTPNRAWYLELAARGRIASQTGGTPPPNLMTNAYYVRLVRDDLPPTEFSVTASGFSAYLIDGQSNPDLQLVRGQTYEFQLNAPGHPFLIKTQATTGTADQFNDGVTNNGAAQGTIRFSVPMDAPDELFYICQFHSSMQGRISLVDP